MKFFETPQYTVYIRDNRYRLITKKLKKEFGSKTLQTLIKRYKTFSKGVYSGK